MAEIQRIPESINEELIQLETKGLVIIGLSAPPTPEKIVAAITAFVRECKDKQRALDEEEIYALGALLGWQYVRGLKWHWGSVVWDFDEENGAIGVLNHDNSLFNNPIGWVAKIVESDGGVPFMLSYNMLLANKTPVFDPDSATGLY